MRFITYPLIIHLILLLGCECPPNLNTDKGFIPKESSYLSFINLLNNTQPYDIYSMNIKIFQLKKTPNVSHQNYLKFQSGIVDFKIKRNDSIVLNTIVQTEANQFYSMLLYRSNETIENMLIWENINKSNNNLYLRFANFSNIDKLRIVLVSDLPQNLEYNLLKNAITDNIAFPSIPFSILLYRLPDNELVTKIENLNINLGHIVYFIITSENNKVEIYQIINNYKIN